MDDDTTRRDSKVQTRAHRASLIAPPDEPKPPLEALPCPKSKSTAPFLSAFNPTLTLENSGSVARDHLASERTWLAYTRTSLAIAGSGVALVQLFTISASPGTSSEDGARIMWLVRPLGASTILLGLGVLAIGVLRYFRIQKALTQGQFPASRQTVVFITGLLAALVAVTFGILIAVPRV